MSKSVSSKYSSFVRSSNLIVKFFRLHQQLLNMEMCFLSHNNVWCISFKTFFGLVQLNTPIFFVHYWTVRKHEDGFKKSYFPDKKFGKNINLVLKYNSVEKNKFEESRRWKNYVSILKFQSNFIPLHFFFQISHDFIPNSLIYKCCSKKVLRFWRLKVWNRRSCFDFLFI